MASVLGRQLKLSASRLEIKVALNSCYSMSVNSAKVVTSIIMFNSECLFLASYMTLRV